MASNDSIVRYLNPWKHRRQLERQQQQVAELRRRDGDDCRRCRRPLRFDLTEGHDLGPKIESILSSGAAEQSVDNLCLTHRRCIAEGNDHTDEVTERLRRKNEAELFAASRRRKRA